MRLINTRTFEVKDFIGHPPNYAILSHLWGDDEVTFQDMAALPAARKKKGFAKIELCCKQAVRDNLDWAWVDTCCIDKSSSAELSESINSMFRWYKRASRCYAFLGDVDEAPGQDPEAALAAVAQDNPPRPPRSADDIDRLRLQTKFRRSRWWTRGWTLQELIAPFDVEFYNCRWELLTSKLACKRFISNTFDIPEAILDRSASLSSVCVADRIAWAAGRKTTREEDMAYSLLGILGVNMPLLYGEGGRRAFVRLQEQTIAAREDHTLFLWSHPACQQYLVAESAEASPRFSNLPLIRCGGWAVPVNAMLASSPDDFSQNLWGSWSRVEPGTRRLGDPPRVTGRGLCLSLLIRDINMRDLDGASEFSRALREFAFWLRMQTCHDAADWLEPGKGGPPAGRLYVAAFPSMSTCEARVLPCMLLVDSGSSEPVPDASWLRPFLAAGSCGPFVRVHRFLFRIPTTELATDRGWALRQCYVSLSTDAGFLQELLDESDYTMSNPYREYETGP